MTKIVVKQTVTNGERPYLVDFICQHCELSKSKVKKVLIYGGGWLKKGHKSRWSRCRKAKQVLEIGDAVEFYYDPHLLEFEPQAPSLLQSYDQWGIWFKPTNLLSQGTKYGDMHSMVTQVTKQTACTSVHLIHRLDREVCGVMLLAYSKSAAQQLSALWRDAKVHKYYHAEVLGKTENAGTVVLPLDEKPAFTEFIKLKELETTSLLEIKIRTGRLHQIRRHMALIGHPVIGDSKYGSGNKSSGGMHLAAIRVKFELQGKQVDCELPVSLYSFN